MRATGRTLLLPVIVGACGACGVLHTSNAPSPARARAGLAHAIDSMVNVPQFRNAHWGILIVDPLAADTLYSRNAAKLFIPASNQKLVTTSVMLEQLGPEFRYRTVIGARGVLSSDGVLNGDLAVIGRGDPTASNHMKRDAMAPLREIADSLWERGVRRITGSVVAVGNAFPGPVAGNGGPWDGLDGSSYAGVDELLFNEGLSVLHVQSGARVGDPPIVETRPSRTYPAVRVLAVTVPYDSTAVPRGGRGGGRGAFGGGRGGPRVSAFHDTATSVVIVHGQIALGDSVNITLPQHDPDAAYVAALAEALSDRGIAVGQQAPASGSVNGSTAERTAGDTTGGGAIQVGNEHVDSLFTMLSVPLREILPAILKPSQNQIAEVFLRTIGLERTGVGTADSGRRVIERQFADWKIPPDGFVVRDGSGLSRNDLISPEAVVDILDVMRRSPNFDLFFQSLPIAGVDGTIGTRMRDTPAQGNLHAKTGTLGLVRSLSGYVRTVDGRLLEFSILCNNWTVPQADVDRVADAIGVSLAQLRLH
jgi:D-alanyl-D-alanine carboxypeptidase/D-alanyl-D-alanine-endopeptidase (penicillin-binding protein 4)